MSERKHVTNIKEILMVIDTSIKRLVSPTAMLIAAILVLNGLGTPGTIDEAIIGASVLLFVFSFSYFIVSLYLADKEFESLGIRQFFVKILSGSYMFVYLLLFAVAVITGLNKVV